MSKENENKVNETEPKFTIEEVRKLIAEAVDEAVSEAMASVKTDSPVGINENRSSRRMTKRRDADDLVTIEIMPTREAKDDVVLSINDETCIIKRGKRVKIKRKFARMYENSRMQEISALQYMEQKQAESLAKLESAKL